MKRKVVEGSLIARAHEVVGSVVEPGDVVVDATVGNGHDTLFLAMCVGDGGKVIGFDVQEDAMSLTRARLDEAGVRRDVCDLHQVGHERMRGYVPFEVSAVMFNLGYLPGGDKEVITKIETTMVALNEAMECLAEGGVLSVMCYPGHAGGEVEARAVAGWVEELGVRAGEMVCYQRVGAREATPFLLVVKKRSLRTEKIGQLR